MADNLALIGHQSQSSGARMMATGATITDIDALFASPGRTYADPNPQDADLRMPAGWWILPLAVLGSGFWVMVAVALF